MNDAFSSILGGMPGGQTRDNLSKMMRPLVDRLSTQATSTAGLVITATSGKKVPKIGAAAYQGVVQGIPVTIAAGTDMPALSGNITAGSYAIYCFFIDTASTVTSIKGAEGTTLAKAKFPQFPEGKALVGYIIVTYASAFTADTTALDTATTVYVSPVGAFDPSYVL
jgi:hypothetical protein